MPANHKITVHDAEIDRDYLEENIADCRGATWHRERWTVETRTPIRTDSGVRVHDHCQICWWELSDSPDPARSVGYTDGQRWICTECYDRFISDATPNA